MRPQAAMNGRSIGPQHPAGTGPRQPVQAAQQSAFTSARGPEQHGKTTRRKGEINATQRDDIAAIANTQAFHGHGRGQIR